MMYVVLFNLRGQGMTLRRFMIYVFCVQYASSDRRNVVPGQYPGGQQDQYGQGTGTGMTGTNDAYGGQPGYGAGTGMGAGGQQQQHRSGGGHLAGKVEHGVGAMVGSKALEARGVEKEQSVSSFVFFHFLPQSC